MISEYFRRKIIEESHAEFEARLIEKKARIRIWPVWHRTCKDIAFFMTKDPRIGSIESKDCVLFNGRRPQPNTVMVCESCQQVIKKLDLLAEMPPRPVQIRGFRHGEQRA